MLLVQRLHWKRASRSNHGLMLTSALRLVHDADKKHEKMNGSNQPLLRPKDLRFYTSSVSASCFYDHYNVHFSLKSAFLQLAMFFLYAVL